MRSKLPPAFAGFLQAFQQRDMAALMAVFADGATVSTPEAEHRGEGIGRWGQRLMDGGGVIRPIYAVSRNGKTVVTVGIDRGIDPVGNKYAQAEFSLSLSGEKISDLAVAQIAPPELAPPVEAYIRATNTANLQALLCTFADDAIVNDQLREYRGISEIEQWAQRDILGNHITMYVVDVLRRPDMDVVYANIEGDFDWQGLPDPLRLSFYFTTRNNKIVQLIVLGNEPSF